MTTDVMQYYLYTSVIQRVGKVVSLRTDCGSIAL